MYTFSNVNLCGCNMYKIALKESVFNVNGSGQLLRIEGVDGFLVQSINGMPHRLRGWS